MGGSSPTVCNIISNAACPLRDFQFYCIDLVVSSFLPVRIQDKYMGNTERW